MFEHAEQASSSGVFGGGGGGGGGGGNRLSLLNKGGGSWSIKLWNFHRYRLVTGVFRLVDKKIHG